MSYSHQLRAAQAPSFAPRALALAIGIALSAIAALPAHADGAFPLTTLHSFGGAAVDGQAPRGKLAVGADGTFYGATFGDVKRETVWSIKRNAATPDFKVLADNKSALGIDGTLSASFREGGEQRSTGVLIRADGTLFGAAAAYGLTTTATHAIQPMGLLYKLEAGKNVIQVVKQFFDSAPDGYAPTGQLAMAADGTIYGALSNGDPTSKLFKLDNAGVYSQLYSLDYEKGDGAGISGGLTLASDGLLYGTVRGGRLAGGDAGGIYSVNPALAGSYKIAAGFKQIDGLAMGQAALVEGNNRSAGVRGTLYGALQGLNEEEFGLGAIYALTPSGTFETLRKFTAINVADTGGADGAYPTGWMTLGADGALYGVTEQGGAAGKCLSRSTDTGCGVVFKITLNATGGFQAYEVLHRFVGTDGQKPNSVVWDNGYLVGVTESGGANNFGTVFQLDTGWRAPVILPTSTLTVSATQVTVGATVALTWTSANATSCTASGQTGWSGMLDTTAGGTRTVTPVLGANTYKLTCVGSSATDIVEKTVTVTGVAPVVTAPADSGGGGGGSLAGGALAMLLAAAGLRRRKTDAQGRQ